MNTTDDPAPLVCFADAVPISALIFGSVLVAGVVISYSLQMLAILKAKSSAGLSYLTLGLALFSSLLTSVNYIILNFNAKFVCCVQASTPAWQCLQNNLTTMQLVGGAICTFIIYVLFLIYYPIPTEIEEDYIAQKKGYFRSKLTFGIGVAIWLLLCATGFTLYYGLHLSNQILGIYGQVIGIISAISVVIQWSPQLYTTWKEGEAGSLSIPMLLMQLPGSLSTVYFQAFLDKGDITTWGPYMVTAVQQSILIMMCLIFWCKRKRGYSYDELDLDDDDEDAFGNTNESEKVYHVQTIHARDLNSGSGGGNGSNGNFGTYETSHFGPYN